MKRQCSRLVRRLRQQSWTGFEHKSGETTNRTAEIREELAKDRALTQIDGEPWEIEWLFDGEVSQPLRELLNDEFLSDPISGDWILDELGDRIPNPNPMPIPFHTNGDFPVLDG